MSRLQLFGLIYSEVEMDVMDYQDHKGRKENKGKREREETKGNKGKRETKERKGNKDHLESKDQLEQQELKGFQEEQSIQDGVLEDSLS